MRRAAAEGTKPPQLGTPSPAVRLQLPSTSLPAAQQTPIAQPSQECRHTPAHLAMESYDSTMPQLPCDLQMQPTESQLHRSQTQLQSMRDADQSTVTQDSIGLQSFSALAQSPVLGSRHADAAKLGKQQCSETECHDPSPPTVKPQHAMQHRILQQTAQQFEESQGRLAENEMATASAHEHVSSSLTSSHESLLEPKGSASLQQTRHACLTCPAKGVALRKRKLKDALLQGSVRRSLRIKAAS